MSRLAEFRKLEQQLASQLAELESLKKDSGLQKEIEFETKLHDLLTKYGFSLRDVISILDPQAARRKGPLVSAPERPARKQRVIKQYRNPHSGAVVLTKGGNNKVLKDWKSQYGGAEVESWLTK